MRGWAGAGGPRDRERALAAARAGPDEQLTVRLWLLRAARAPAQREPATAGAAADVVASPSRSSRRARRRASSSCGQTLDRLAPLDPSFVSVTCGAGGSGERRDARRAARDRARGRRCRLAGHLTCVGRSRAEVDDDDRALLGRRRPPHRRAARRHARRPRRRSSRIRTATPSSRRAGRGDPPAVAPFEVSVAAYPEPHPDSRLAAPRSRRARAQGRRRRDPRDHPVLLRHRRDRAGCATGSIGAGIALTVVPGIMLATNFAGVARMAARCGASIPELAGRALRRPRRRPADAQARRRDRRRRAGRPAAPRGLRGLPLLHAQPGRLAPAVCRLLDVRPAGTERRMSAGGMSAGALARKRRIEALHAAAAERILVLDGSWGAKIQELRLTEEEFRGERFADHPLPLRGNNDVLCLTRPEVITELTRRLPRRRRRHHLDQHLHRRRRSRRPTTAPRRRPRAEPRRGAGSRARPPTASRRPIPSQAALGRRARSARPTARCRCRPTSTIPAPGRSTSTRSTTPTASRRSRSTTAASTCSWSRRCSTRSTPRRR